MPGDRFVIGYLGTLGLAHGLDEVIEAAEQMRDEPFCFMLMGPGAEREKLMAEVRTRALGNVVIPPPQSKQEMPRAWSTCDLSLVHLKNTPVFSSVIPSKIFESMAMGKPVLLAGPAGEASRLIEKEQAGVAIASGDPRVLADAIREMARNHPARHDFAESSQRAAPRYSREKQAAAMLEALERSLVAADHQR